MKAKLRVLPRLLAALERFIGEATRRDPAKR